MGKPDLRQVERHQGQLHNHSFLPHDRKFSGSDLHTGSTFTADVDRLVRAIDKWRQCSDQFSEVVRETPLSAHITDGSGPIANALGSRFDHRIGSAGGVGYATDAYLAGLRQILEGLIQTTAGYSQSEAAAARQLATENGAE